MHNSDIGMQQLIKNFIKRMIGRSRLEHGNMNYTRTEGGTVIKRFDPVEGTSRYLIELEALKQLRDVDVPLPRLIEQNDAQLELTISKIDARNAADLNNKLELIQLQRNAAALLKSIHSIPAARFQHLWPDAEGYLCHGDYTVRNLLVGHETIEIIAVIDWEKMHPGDTDQDLFWYEWVFRQVYPTHKETLKEFYQTYFADTASPSWEKRKDGMLQLLVGAIESATESENPDGISYWKKQHAAAAQFTE